MSSEGMLTAAESAHLRVIARYRVAHGKGWWLMTAIKITDPLHPALVSLRDTGMIRASDRMVCGPLQVREDYWGVCLTDKGEIVARLLELI